jgi:hypothetical protein
MEVFMLASSQEGYPIDIPKVVTKPLADLRACTSKGRASNDQRSETRPTGEHSIAGCSRHHRPVEIVCRRLQWMLGFHKWKRRTGVIFYQPIRMNDIRMGRAVADVRERISNRVWWIQKINLPSILSLLNLFIALHRVQCIRGRRSGPSWRHLLVLGLLVRVVAWVGAEARRLVHVNPCTVDIDAIRGVEEEFEFVVPEGLGGRMEPVGPDDHSRPNN